MKHFALKNWLNDDSGAVTVDWVVLTAAVVGLGIASVAAVSTGTGSLGTSISDALSDASVAVLGALGDGAADAVADARTLLSVAQETYDSWMETLAFSSDEDLASSVAGVANTATYYLENGPPEQAALYIDAVAAYEQEILSRGGTLPDGVPTSRELDDAYNALI